MEIVIEIVIAALSLILGTAASEQQMKGQEARASRETFVRHLYQAVKNRFGVSIDQLNQVLDKLGLKFNQLAESSRGSARLARATQIYREFIKEYPEAISKINNTKNIIQNEINNLDAKEAAAASKIENRETFTNKEVLQDAVGSIYTVNNALTESGNNENLIDTGLVSNPVASDKTEKQLDAINGNGLYEDPEAKRAQETLEKHVGRY